MSSRRVQGARALTSACSPNCNQLHLILATEHSSSSAGLKEMSLFRQRLKSLLFDGRLTSLDPMPR